MAETPGPPPPPPPPVPPKESESLIKRYKVIWRLLLISNLALGAYMFARARMRDMGIVKSKPREKSSEDVKATEEEVPCTTTTIATDTVPEEDLFFTPPVMAPVKEREPIPEDQQRELFQWMLEEKRKIQPADREEKKRNDEEKAILKQYIRSTSIPRL